VYSDYHDWCVANDFSFKPTQGFWLKLKRCRTDLVAKKVRIPGTGLMNACSIILRDPEMTAANGDSYMAAA